MQEKEQALLAQVIDVIAEKFDKHAVLRGGMVLKLLGSPRWTNDLDYVFVPFSSKKDIVQDVIACLKKIDGATIRHSLNSKCLRVIVSVEGVTIQVEAKVADRVKSLPASTRLFSPQFNLPKRMIPVVDLEVALSHKLAAWNERRLMRDLYDVWFFLQMGVRPDTQTLKDRLAKQEVSRLVKKENRYPGHTLNEFYDFLREACAQLQDDEISQELSAYLAEDELQGLALMFRSAFVKLKESV